VFFWLWLGHMYMRSKGFPIHSPRSSIYSETLARCTRAVYPPRFLWMAARRWASVFLWLWLGHMYMGSKGFSIHSPQSPIYGETLARCTRVVYPYKGGGGCPGRRWNPSKSCMWTYDIWVKMWFNLKYSITWILGVINMQKKCNKYFAVRLVA
jgi:hypothetical protein